MGGPDEFPDSTVATYSCNDGYVLEGETHRICNVVESAPAGEFDGVEPLCVRKSLSKLVELMHAI